MKSAATPNQHQQKQNNSQPAEARSEQQREYLLSAASDAICRLVALAPKLTEAELRILLHLCPLAVKDEWRTAQASLRDIAVATGCARSNIRAALRRLSTRKLITVRTGKPNRPTAIILQFLKTVELGGSMADPPAPPGGSTANPPGGPTTIPPPLLGVSATIPRTGPTADPPATETKGLEDGNRSAFDIDYDPIQIIDRLLTARPSDFPADRRRDARRWLHGYQAKMSRDRSTAEKPPDEKLIAQFLSVAEWPRLEAMLYDLLAERQEPGSRYAWYVSVALQRIHGIQPEALRAAREAKKSGTAPPRLRVVKPPPREPDPAPPELPWTAATPPPPPAPKSPPPPTPAPDECELSEEQIAALDAARIRARYGG